MQIRERRAAQQPKELQWAKSMTGFGKAECSQDGRTVSVDIKSVNNRFLDVNFRMPRLFSPIEEQLRGILKSKLSRGKIDVYVSYKNTCEDAVSISANYPVIASYLNELQEISKQFHIPYKPKLSLLMELPDAFYSETPTEDETAAALLCQAFSQAVDNGWFKPAKQKASIWKQIFSPT